MNPLMIAAVLTLFAGLTLLVFGLRSRRVGQELRCRKCKYNLTGVDLSPDTDGSAATPACPECGRSLGPKLVRRGLRRRRLGFITGGALLSLCFGTLLWLYSQNGYSTRERLWDLLPNSVLIPIAQCEDWTALTILEKRHGDGTLRDDQAIRLLGLPLRTGDEQKIVRGFRRQMLNLWLRLEENDALTDDQRLSFFDQAS